ncbi:hypothetical protein DAQ1742_01970 [Dickeya aquatica]|uniref:Uncharacterized protein n=1 Tax=Dickeya aquatica TaxID=1401087 RepID=A0A375AA28_9GAMM|nr:hypothetical protein DAQ1742_01970 [Dickeya aquatica]
MPTKYTFRKYRLLTETPQKTRILSEFAGFLLPVICRDTPFTAGKFSYTLSYTAPYNYKSV